MENTCREQELQNCFRPVAANTLSLKHSEHSRVATSPHRQHSLGPAGQTELRGSVSSRSHLKSSFSCQNWDSGKKNPTPESPELLLTAHHPSLTVQQQICYIQLQGRDDFAEHFIFLPKTWHLDNEARWDLGRKKKRERSHPEEEPNPRDFSLNLLSLSMRQKGNRESRGLSLSHAWIQCWI